MASWVESANDPAGDFPLENLPYGRFRRDRREPWRVGVAIGEQILDLRLKEDLNAFMARGPGAWRLMRRALKAGLEFKKGKKREWSRHLVPQREVEMGLPCEIGDYSDFYAGIHHATRIGRLFRPDTPLLPNYKWVPIGYHGRASSIVVSGSPVTRPSGQTKAADREAPAFGPSRRLDYEVELGFVIGRGNALGHPIPVAKAEEHIFGVVLLNDWSARDIQGWEYQPLGPFLSKSFATTISPWIVTMDALAPFRCPAFERAAGDPRPLPYLLDEKDQRSGGVEITLEVHLKTRQMKEAARISRGNSRDAYWTSAQMVAHQTSNGCNLKPGDLLGSGTLSGAAPEAGGSLMELTQGGKVPLELPGGETRAFLEDGDTVIMRGRCEREGVVPIGFGEASGVIRSSAR